MGIPSLMVDDGNTWISLFITLSLLVGDGVGLNKCACLHTPVRTCQCLLMEYSLWDAFHSYICQTNLTFCFGLVFFHVSEINLY